ncbi:MAG: GNAT family N-acetyltransferase [Micavibrio sp.]|nr:GNAT family N-acetyltransferase [Micavibrio sp.]
MILETSRLVLRPLVLEDHKDIQKHFPHWDVVKYLSKNAIKWPYPDDGAEKFLRNIALPAMARGDDWYWGITRRDKPDEVIGVIHLRRDTASGNRGLWIAQEHQGSGYMKEALEAVNDYAFGALGFDKLVIKNAADNEASRQLKIKTGAEMLETRPATHYLGGSAQQEVWQLTAEKWNAFKVMRDFTRAALTGGANAVKTLFCKAQAYMGIRPAADIPHDDTSVKGSSPHRQTAAKTRGHFATKARRQKCRPPAPFNGFNAAFKRNSYAFVPRP